MNNLNHIQERNNRVEADKAWETSKTRRALIAGATYIIIGWYLSFLKIEDAWLHALVPTMGYLLSTLSLHYIKLIWIERIYKKGTLS